MICCPEPVVRRPWSAVRGPPSGFCCPLVCCRQSSAVCCPWSAVQRLLSVVRRQSSSGCYPRADIRNQSSFSTWILLPSGPSSVVRIPTESAFLPVRLPLPAFLLFLIAPFFSVGSFRLLARSALSAVCRQSCQSCQSSHTHRPAHCHISQPAPTIPVWLPGSVVMDLPSAAIGLLLSLRSLPCGNTRIDWSNQHKPYKYKFFFSIPAHFRPLFCLSLFLCIPLRVIRAFFLTFSHALFPGISFFVILTFFRSSSHALLPGISFCVIRTLFRSSSYVLLPGISFCVIHLLY